jgi:outer membrane protein assembly factor BamB
MIRHSIVMLIIILINIYIVQVTAQEHLCSWTHFRGTNLNGYVADDKNYPVEWNDSTNIAWKTHIPGRGWSSPVVYGDQIWLTTATPDGSEMYVVCIEFSTGALLYNMRVFEPDSLHKTHAVNSFATPTPCIEDGFVYAHFGRYGTACINTGNGSVVWKRSDLLCDHWEGPGSSPILHGNKLILHLEGIDIQFIVAIDKRTGETLWKTYRPAELYEPIEEAGRKAFVTPLVINVRDKDLLISNGASVCIAYDIENGSEVWRIVRGEHSTISMPFSWDGILFYYTSFMRSAEGRRHSELLAVNPVGYGNNTHTNILWKMEAPILQILTPVTINGLIYTIDANNTAYCIDALKGTVYWSERWRGKYNSSPVAASGNIYFSSTLGKTIVLKEGKTPEIIAENKLDGEIWATPAFVDGSILMRTSKYLYKIMKK